MRFHNYIFSGFKPKVVSDLIRVGNQETDGGYLISKRIIGITKVLIGLGINYDWSFEADFKARNENLSIYCYDFSVGKSIYRKGLLLSVLNILSPNTYANILFRKLKPRTVITQPITELLTLSRFNKFFQPANNNYFFQLGVSDHRSKIFITIDDVFSKIGNFDSLPDNSVFIKMDIESSEYDILEDIIKQQSKINGLAIEFHNTKQLWNEFNYIVDELKKYYEIIHVHGNNCCGYVPGTEIPNLVEITFLKRSLMDSQEINSQNNFRYPLDNLDKPNMPKKTDLKLSF